MVYINKKKQSNLHQHTIKIIFATGPLKLEEFSYNSSYSRCKEKNYSCILLLKYCSQTVKLKSAFEFIPSNSTQEVECCWSRLCH